MAEPLSFKHFMVVDYRPGEPELVKYQAHKRRRQQGAGSNAEYSSTNPPSANETLTNAQRLALARRMKKIAPKIKLGQMRAKLRMASKEKLMKRARKAARDVLVRKITKDIPKGDLSFARRAEIEKRLAKPQMKKVIDRVAKRMFKDVRKKELERKRAKTK